MLEYFSTKVRPAVVAGDNHSFLLTASGKVYACGGNCHCQLGLDGRTFLLSKKKGKVKA